MAPYDNALVIKYHAAICIISQCADGTHQFIQCPPLPPPPITINGQWDMVFICLINRTALLCITIIHCAGNALLVSSFPLFLLCEVSPNSHYWDIENLNYETESNSGLCAIILMHVTMKAFPVAVFVMLDKICITSIDTNRHKLMSSWSTFGS